MYATYKPIQIKFKDTWERPGESVGITMMNQNTTTAAEKINSTTQAQSITKEQIEKVIDLKGAFYAKSKSRGRFNGSITYNEISIYENVYDHILKMELRCCRCEDDHVIDEQEFHLTEDGWRELSQYSHEYHNPVTDEILDEIPGFWVSVRNADEDFINYVNHLFKILR